MGRGATSLFYNKLTLAVSAELCGKGSWQDLFSDQVVDVPEDGLKLDMAPYRVAWFRRGEA